MRIRLYDHPFAPVAPRVFEAESLGRWLIDHYGRTPAVNVQVYAGEPSAKTDITGNLAAMLASDHDEYVILESPGIPAAYVFYAVIAVAFAAVAYLLAPKPQMPSNVNRSQQSPNNTLGDRQNQVRTLQRVEDIYGMVKAIPSLMMPTYIKYIDNQEYEYGYYCVGRGYYDPTDSIMQIRDGDTLIADIGGASAAVYAPFTSPNSGDAPVLLVGAPIVDSIPQTTRAIEVDGIALKAPNQLNLVAGATYTFLPDVGGDIINQADGASPNFNAIAVAGDSITITTTPFYLTTNDGVNYDGSPVNPSNVSGPYDYSGTRIVASVNDGQLVLTTSTFAIAKSVTATISLVGKTGWTDWVTLPSTTMSEIWVNVVAESGLYLDNGGKSQINVAYEIQVEKLDGALLPTGVVESVMGSMSGASSDQVAITMDQTLGWTGPARVRMQRTSDHDFTSAGTVQDEIKWTDLYSAARVDKTHFGNKTTIHTVTRANQRATAVKTRELNCIASRLLPTYDGTAFSGAFDATGLHVSGTINPTSKLVDIIAAVSIDPKIGARTLATDVDMAQIWGVQQLLDAWSTECGQFNYTLDSDETSYEETVAMIADAGFCTAYRQSGKIRLAFDRAQAASTALFTHRNKQPSTPDSPSETITRVFASDSSYDGVQFVYSDPDTAQSETITLPLDGSYTKLKKYEIAGIRSFVQAWLRANREYQKLIGQRITIETSTTMDARSLLPNARIDIVDNTSFRSYDGEVIGQAGLALTLSQDVEFTVGLPHSIVLMKRDGTLQSVGCIAGAEPNQVVLSAAPAQAIRTVNSPADGQRTIYSFAADSARGAMAYLVQSIDVSGGTYAKIQAVNYSDDYYQFDYAAIPDSASIIN